MFKAKRTAGLISKFKVKCVAGLIPKFKVKCGAGLIPKFKVTCAALFIRTPRVHRPCRGGKSPDPQVQGNICCPFH